MKKIKIVTGVLVKPETLLPGNLVRVRFLDEVEPKGYFWWYAKCIEYKGVCCLVQLDYDYTGQEEDVCSTISYSDYDVELLASKMFK